MIVDRYDRRDRWGLGDLSDHRPGDYAIVVTTNHDKELLEVDHENNPETAAIGLTNTTVTVLDDE